MVQSQAVFGSSGASAQVSVEGQDYAVPIIIGLGILGVVIAAIVLKK